MAEMDISLLILAHEAGGGVAHRGMCFKCVEYGFPVLAIILCTCGSSTHLFFLMVYLR